MGDSEVHETYPGGTIQIVDDPMAEVDAAKAPAAPGSLLADLRGRRERIVTEKLHTDLKVPRWDDEGGPAIFVRYGPTTQARVDAANKQARASKSKHATLVANATVLADACLGIFAVVDGEKVSIDPDDPHGELLKFEPKLAELLGVRAGKAAQIVRDPETNSGLYFTDGDVISTAMQLAEWSGFAAEQMELDEGN